MEKIQVRRIGPAEAARLLSGAAGGTDRAALTRLLGLAAAPPEPAELSGGLARAAVFARTFREADRAGAPADQRRARLSWLSRALVVKVAGGLAVLLLGSAAVAGGTGNLPGAVQHTAHELLSAVGVPVPDAKSPQTGSGQPKAGAASSGSAAGPRPSAAGPRDALGLCRAWQAARKDGQGKPTAAAPALATMAGGPEKVPGFCGPILAQPHPADPSSPGPSGSPTPPAHPTPPVPTPSHPGKGKGSRSSDPARKQ